MWCEAVSVCHERLDSLKTFYTSPQAEMQRDKKGQIELTVL